MYMYEQNFKRGNQGVSEADAVQMQSLPVTEMSEGDGNKRARKPLSIGMACIIAAAILVVSGIADFFILCGGGLF